MRNSTSHTDWEMGLSSFMVAFQELGYQLLEKSSTWLEIFQKSFKNIHISKGQIKNLQEHILWSKYF